MLKLLRRSLPPDVGSVAAPVAAAARGAPAGDDAAVGALLDAVGGLLQAIGQYALDTETRSADDARDAADAWRRHVTTGMGHPADAAPVGDDGRAAAAAARAGAVAERDWSGMLRFATTQQRGERERAQRVHADLRDAVWTLVRGLGEVVGGEEEAERVLTTTVTRVREAVSAPPEELRAAALAAASEITSLLAHRERARRAEIASLGAHVSRLGAALAEARREGTIDPLTRLGNRRALDDALANAASVQGLWREPASLVLVDLDGLKTVNDRAGHPAGDEALRAVAHELARTFMGATDVLCRHGGDEFAVVLRDTALAEARRLADRLVLGVAARARRLAPSLMPAVAGDAADAPPFGVSVGVAELARGEPAAAWMRRADEALYAAKRAGRGRVVVAE